LRLRREVRLADGQRVEGRAGGFVPAGVLGEQGGERDGPEPAAGEAEEVAAGTERGNVHRELLSLKHVVAYFFTHLPSAPRVVVIFASVMRNSTIRHVPSFLRAVYSTFPLYSLSAWNVTVPVAVSPLT